MAISVLDQSLKNKLDQANANVIADEFRLIKIGSHLRAMKTFLRHKTPVASAVQLATLDAIDLPDDACACTILRAYARAGTGTLGELTVDAFGTTPAAGHIAVAPNGDIVTLHADAWTDLDIVYEPERYDIFEVTLPLAANVLTIPTALTAKGVVLLMEAEITKVSAGAATGLKIVLVPGAGAPAAGQARLNLAKATVTFAGADNGTQARLKLAVSAATDMDALLTAVSNIA